eukprot:1866115-Alexandrium_andersonii.AAC.1
MPMCPRRPLSLSLPAPQTARPPRAQNRASTIRPWGWYPRTQSSQERCTSGPTSQQGPSTRGPWET